MDTIFERIKKVFWENKLLSNHIKEKIFYGIKSISRGRAVRTTLNDTIAEQYIDEVLSIQDYKSKDKYVNTSSDKYTRNKNDSKLIAYYLPQFYPNEYNDRWWGKGTTEWNNVSKAMPQYIGHYQPRLPGELGYYDLRIDENIKRQVELAEMYGIYGFCYYYYWFDDVRLLDLPFDKFINNKDINFPFCMCWVNESWSRQWFGISEEPLIKQNTTVDSYRNFIKGIRKYLDNKNYITIKGKKVLLIYRPYHIPDIKSMLCFWREYVRNEYGYELYLIAVMNNKYSNFARWNFIEKGFDGICEFALGSQREFLEDIKSEKKFICNEFSGNVYSYKYFIRDKKYFSGNLEKLYRAVCPMWDNSARKVNKGIVFDGSTPDLYKIWLKDIIAENKTRNDLDENFIFINAWNEWAEGAYLEPDRFWGYGYLQATREAVEESR